MPRRAFFLVLCCVFLSKKGVGSHITMSSQRSISKDRCDQDGSVTAQLASMQAENKSQFADIAKQIRGSHGFDHRAGHYFQREARCPREGPCLQSSASKPPSSSPSSWTSRGCQHGRRPVHRCGPLGAICSARTPRPVFRVFHVICTETKAPGWRPDEYAGSRLLSLVCGRKTHHATL